MVKIFDFWLVWKWLCFWRRERRRLRAAPRRGQHVYRWGGAAGNACVRSVVGSARCRYKLAERASAPSVCKGLGGATRAAVPLIICSGGVTSLLRLDTCVRLDTRIINSRAAQRVCGDHGLLNGLCVLRLVRVEQLDSRFRKQPWMPKSVQNCETTRPVSFASFCC